MNTEAQRFFNKKTKKNVSLFLCVAFFIYLCSQMQKSDKIITIILALVALGLLTLCIASLTH